MKQINYQLVDCTEVEKNYMINHKTIACSFIEISRVSSYSSPGTLGLNTFVEEIHDYFTCPRKDWFNCNMIIDT